jgi:geranylgeranyl pyrophosphate synthase
MEGNKVKRDIEQQRKLLPFLSALKKLSPDDRIIVLSHLDFKTRDLLYATIVSVLRSRKIPLEWRRKLKQQLAPHKKELRQISRQYGRGRVEKKERATRHLARIGGESLGVLIDAAIPLLLEIFTS